MRFLVLLCLCLLQISVAVSPTLAAVRPSCPPTTPATPVSDVVAPPPTPGSIVFNEILDNPGTRTLWNCAAQTDSPWLELFNPHTQTYDLHASFAAIDHGPGTTRFYLASNSLIAPHGFFVLFNQFAFQGQSTLFRLLLLGIPVDQVTVPALASDQSYARMPDGGADWQITSTPTIGVSNTLTTASVASPVTTRTPPTPTQTSPRQSTHHTASTTPAERASAVNTPPRSPGQQPAWASLHLPRSTPTIQNTTDRTIAPVVTTIPTPQISIWPFLIGLIGLSAIICGVVYWHRRRLKAT